MSRLDEANQAGWTHPGAKRVAGRTLTVPNGLERGFVGPEWESVVMNQTVRKVLAGLVLALVMVACVKADDEPTPVKKPAKKATGGAIDGEGVVNLLTGMGYEPKESKDAKGDVVGGSIRCEGKQFNYTLYVTLSGSKKFLWMSMGFGVLPSPKVPPEVLKGLLALNDSGPVFYSYDEKNNVIRLQTSLYNRGITAPQLKEMLTLFDNAVTAGSKYWNPKAWETGKAKPKSKPKPPDDE